MKNKILVVVSLTLGLYLAWNLYNFIAGVDIETKKDDNIDYITDMLFDY